MSCRTLVRQPLCLWIEEWRYVFARITQLMDDTILNFRLGKYSPNRRRKSRQVIRAGNENVLHASFFSPLSTVAQYLALSFSPTHIPNTSFLRAQRTYAYLFFQLFPPELSSLPRSDCSLIFSNILSDSPAVLANEYNTIRTIIINAMLNPIITLSSFKLVAI